MRQLTMRIDAILSILTKAQVNLVKYVSQKVTLHRSTSLTKAMDGLFEYKDKCA